MLTLTRKVGQSINIGNITVHVAQIRGKQVRLQIDAPREVKVMRSELISRGADDADGDETAEQERLGPVRDSP